ncbi:MAG: hypothetical protein LAQ30_02440 [Acidobacteriia bacterium]|nr:hypothetical protein [Terriglobia bacterium]
MLSLSIPPLARWPWPTTYAARVGGRNYLLPQNGFAVKGPKIEQWLALVNGRPVTSIRAAGYEYTDGK